MDISLYVIVGSILLGIVAIVRFERRAARIRRMLIDERLAEDRRADDYVKPAEWAPERRIALTLLPDGRTRVSDYSPKPTARLWDERKRNRLIGEET